MYTRKDRINKTVFKISYVKEDRQTSNNTRVNLFDFLRGVSSKDVLSSSDYMPSAVEEWHISDKWWDDTNRGKPK